MHKLMDLAGSLECYRKSLLGKARGLAKLKGYTFKKDEDDQVISDWLIDNGYPELGQALFYSDNYMNRIKNGY